MKLVREALRLHHECGLSLRKTSEILSISRPALTEYLESCQRLNINMILFQLR